MMECCRAAQERKRVAEELLVLFGAHTHTLTYTRAHKHTQT